MEHHNNEDLIQLYGFTQDPNTLNYIIIMDHAKNGSLKNNLSDIIKDKWITKLMKLAFIISGLNVIHQQRMIHCDFHHGNILNSKSYFEYTLSISDLGLCVMY